MSVLDWTQSHTYTKPGAHIDHLTVSFDHIHIKFITSTPNINVSLRYVNNQRSCILLTDAGMSRLDSIMTAG